MASSIGEDTPKSPPEDGGTPHSQAAENHAGGKQANGEHALAKQQYSIGATPGHPGDSQPASPNGTVVPVSPSVGSPSGPRQYTAAPFSSDAPGPDAIALPGTEREFQRYARDTEINWLGCIVFFVYCCSFVFYMWIRIAKTLNLGPYDAYGWYVLAVEVMGATTVILYGVNLLWNPVLTPYEEDPDNPGLTLVKHPYHVRVIVPCYSESLDIIRRTVMAAYDAILPEGCMRTIYLCDDGKDARKRKWVDSLGADVVYVSGRRRPPGEINGKSGNINNCISQIYPRGMAVPGDELVCVFDADQVASKEFFLKTLPLFDGGDDVGMVLSPQCFHNLNLHSDIFNHSNVHFWEYMQPGYDALGFISCTGTNFLVRSNALLESGGSPTWTLTEDFALGMELKKYGWHCRYVQEYLAIGEAPDQIRNCFQQRSRWCKGHFQIMFSRQHCPLGQSRLSLFMKLLFSSGVWSYVVGAISTPTFIIIPIITIWFGVFPIVVSWWAALGLTVYFITTQSVLYYVRSYKHIEALWFANTANSVLWWTYVKAFWRALNSVFGDKIKFKTTLKGASLLVNSGFRDLWVPGLCFCLLMASVGEGLKQLFTGATVTSPLAISVIWAIYNAIPPGLVLFYALVGKGVLLQYLCRFCMLLSFFCGASAVGLLWGLYPEEYNFKQVINYVNQYYDANRVGNLPQNVLNTVPWVQSSLPQEATAGPLGRDMSGGWLTGGAAFSTKATIPTAFAVAMMAWSVISFPEGFKSAGASTATLSNIRWGADYLLKTVDQGSLTSDIVYQMGNLTIASQTWQRPWDITSDRPYYALTQSAAGADLLGPIVGALASSAIAITKEADPDYYNTLLTAAQAMYKVAAVNAKGGPLYSAALGNTVCANYGNLASQNPTANCSSIDTNGSSIPVFYTTTKYDAVAWAAVWMYKATGDKNYLEDATDFYQLHVYNEGVIDAQVIFNWVTYYWGVNVLLAQTTDENTFHEATQGFLQKWVCAIGGVVQYTPRGRAYNLNSPTLGDTANVAFLAATYARSVGGRFSKQASRYWCWARGQMRYMLGDGGQSYVVGFGSTAPTHAQNPAASCPPIPAPCNYVNNFLSSTPNNNVLYGALVEGNGFSDNFVDVRSQNDTRVAIHNNAGFMGLLASMQVAPGTWEQCLQGYGVLNKANSIC